MRAEELTDPEQLLGRWAEGVRRGVLEDAEQARYTFVALSRYALRIGANPPGLFAKLVRDVLISGQGELFITHADEDAASRLLRDHPYEAVMGEHITLPDSVRRRPGLSDDAIRLREARQWAATRGFVDVDLFKLMKTWREFWPWTLKQFNAATAELDAAASCVGKT